MWPFFQQRKRLTKSLLEIKINPTCYGCKSPAIIPYQCSLVHYTMHEEEFVKNVQVTCYFRPSTCYTVYRLLGTVYNYCSVTVVWQWTRVIYPCVHNVTSLSAYVCAHMQVYFVGTDAWWGLEGLFPLCKSLQVSLFPIEFLHNSSYPAKSWPELTFYRLRPLNANTDNGRNPILAGSCMNLW